MRLLLPALLACLCTTVQAATPQTLYAEGCAHCHTPGISDAPKLGDRSVWLQRIRPGMNLLYQAAIDGVPNTAMAPKGGHRDMTDADIRAIVDFMIAAAGLPPAALAAAARYDALGITDREFIRLDVNFDGALTPEELRHDPPLARGLERFDRNGDGKLNVAEYRALETALEHERASVTVNDEQLLSRVRAALGALPQFPLKGIKVDAAAGTITLSGVVEHAADAQRAYRAIQRIAGIKTIDNRLVPGELLGWD